MDALVQRYLIFGLPKVQGWLDFDSAEVIAALADVQRTAGYKGAVGEIGVHHGKLFILLLLTADENEKSFAVDVFEHQHLNIDGSGRGDKEKFLENICQWTKNNQIISILPKSSFDVSPNDIVGQCGYVRLASIDGGHTKECTLNDLDLIENVLTDNGVAIIDDYFNCDWPDVSTGVAEYFLSKKTKLVPFAISPNKVYLTKFDNSEFYRAQLRRKFKPYKNSKMFGAEVDIYNFTPSGWKGYLKMATKESPVGPYMRALKNVLRRVY